MSLHGKGGGSRGSLPTFARLKDFSHVLYVHPAETGRGFADIKHVVRGVLDVRLAVTGWRGDAREIGSPDSASFSEGGDALQAALAIIDDWRGGTLKGCEVNVGEITAGDRVGSVPASARARVRVLFDDARAFGDILTALGRDAERVAASRSRGERRIGVTVERDGLGANYAAVAWDSPACRVLRSSIEDVTGRPPTSYPTHFAGDIRYPLRLAGVPSFGMGSLAGGFYGADEWVDIDDLVRLVAVVMLCADRWARLA
jgi:acetylornithine deacetylase/succinyl-diaminopimelate desuccinylase-like protein